MLNALVSRPACRCCSLVICLLLGFSGARTHAQTLVCDVDGDADVDRVDIGAIFAARNLPASGADDPRDYDGDGFITINDGRACTLQCTLPACASPDPTAIDNDGDGFTEVAGDCDDTDPAISPAAAEIPGNDIDENCDGFVDPGNNPPVITSTPVTGARVNAAYVYPVAATDPDGDTLTYALTEQPAGTQIDAATGLVTWTPTQVGAFPVTVRAADPAGLFAEQRYLIDVTTFVNSPPRITSSPVTTLRLEPSLDPPEIVDLRDWVQHHYDFKSAFGLGQWQFEEEGTVARQLRNADASLLLSSFAFDSGLLEGRMSVPRDRGDDDLIGFVFGFQDPDHYYLFDWKAGTQPADGFGTAERGISVKLVDATPPLEVRVVSGRAAGYDLWNTQGSDRVRSLYFNPNVGWRQGTEYTFSLDFRPGRFTIVLREGDTVLDSITLFDDTFEDGNFGFYTYSQENVQFRGILRTLGAQGAYVYAATAEDPDVGQVLSWSLPAAPDGMTIDPSTGRIDWTAGVPTIGVYPVTVRVEDPFGLADEQSFLLTVLDDVPIIASSPFEAAVVARPYVYDVVAIDRDGDELVYSLDFAPTGMSIDPISGLVAWTPAADQVGAHPVRVRVADPDGNVDAQTYTITVRDTNFAPSIDSEAPTGASQGQPYRYSIEVSDPDPGEVLSFALVEGPTGMTIANRQLAWTPLPTQRGPNAVTIRVTDAVGLFAEQSFVVDVAGSTPVITSTPPTNAVPGAAYAYDVAATDADPGDVLAFELLAAPIGMGIDPATGQIEWLPLVSQLGASAVTVRVIDASGLAVTQSFDVLVAEDTSPPTVGLTLSSLRVDPGETATLTIVATDNAGTPTVTVTANGVPLAVDANGEVVLPTDASGRVTIVVDVIDAAGNVTTEALLLAVRDPSDVTPPVALLESPDDLAEVTLLEDVVGTVDDDNLFRYQLGIALGTDVPFTVVAEGFDPVASSVLGVIDATRLENGIYRVRLIAEDINGALAVDERAVRVDGQGKIGLFTLTYTDLVVPVGGLPITIERSYDSRVKTSRDFGVGWTLEIGRGTFTQNRPVGDGWQLVSGSGIFGLPCAQAIELASHAVEVRLSDFESYSFAPRLTNQAVIVGGCVADVVFDLLEGTRPGAALALPDGNEIFYQAGTAELLDAATLELFDPRRVRLVLPVATIELDRDAGGITRASDANGNVLEIRDDGIFHSSGAGVQFLRDANGRIERITDPTGAALSYAYDTAGDLVGFTNRSGATETYAYDALHYLVEIGDPLGQAIRTEYDADGRVVRVVDASGAEQSFAYDLSGRAEVIRNARGFAKTLLFDERGNTVEEIDALGGRTVRAFDTDDNLTAFTDPLGRTTRFTHDADGNELSEENPLGAIETRTFDAAGRPTTITDPLGQVVDQAWSPAGQLQSRTDAAGFTTAFGYDALGNLTSITDGFGVTTYEVDARGQILREIDALGAAREYTRDANGNLLTISLQRGVERLVWSFEYDADGREIARVDADGFRSTTEYDAAGRVAAQTDRLDRRTTFEYDPRGLLTRTVYPDATEALLGYDEVGNLVTETDRAGRVTRHVYDALDRRIETIYPDATARGFEYDAAGQLIAEIDENGARTDYEYDLAGRRVRTFLPTVVDGSTGLGARPEIVETYDAAGNRVAVTDPLGHTTSFEYDARGEIVARVLPDGSREETLRGERGSASVIRDALGNETRFSYDGVGRLAGVEDALGGSTLYVRDERGDVVSEVDALGRATSRAYDRQRRPTVVTRPLGQQQTWHYDAEGQLEQRVAFDGAVVTHDYDPAGNEVRRLTPERIVEFTYSATGRVLTARDERGVTAYDYDMRDRLVRRAEPDGRAISYGYDAAGRLTSIGTDRGTIGYGVDALGRVTSVVDWDGRETRFFYDLAGGLARVERPNGTVLARTSDLVGRTIVLEERDAGGSLLLSLDYVRDPNGRVTRVEREDGRRSEFDYDALGRLLAERAFVAGSGIPARTVTHGLDAVGNRTVRVDSTLGTTTYTYDANDRLLAENGPAGLSTYAYDADGNRVARNDPGGQMRYRWDSEDRLVGIDVDGDGIEDIDYAFDAFGDRVGETRFGVETRFLVDANREFSEPLLETAPDGSLRAAHVPGPIRVASDIAGDLRFFHADALGSVLALSDAAGTLTDTYDYDAYGSPTGRVGTGDNRFRFTGEPYDEATALVHLRARAYEPGTGLFLSTDPFAGDLRMPVTLHRYLYAGGDPVNRRDPSGRQFLIEVFFVHNEQGRIRGAEARSAQVTGDHIVTRVYSEVARNIGRNVARGAQIDAETGTLIQGIRASATQGFRQRLRTTLTNQLNTLVRGTNARKITYNVCRLGVQAAQAVGLELQATGDPIGAVILEVLNTNVCR